LREKKGMMSIPQIMTNMLDSLRDRETERGKKILPKLEECRDPACVEKDFVCLGKY
jgi:hypothetical protein